MPNDPQKLARIVGVPYEEFLAYWNEIQTEGYEILTVTEDGRKVTQKRLLSEWRKAQDKTEQMRRNALKRWAAQSAQGNADAEAAPADEDVPEPVSGEHESSGDSVGFFSKGITDCISKSISGGICQWNDNQNQNQNHIHNQNQVQDIKNNMRGGVEYPPEFEEFWQAYPKARRLRKEQTLANWKQIIRSGTRPEDVVAAALNYADACCRNGTEPRFILHSTTFTGARSKAWKDYAPGGSLASPEAEAGTFRSAAQKGYDQVSAEFADRFGSLRDEEGFEEDG